MRTLLLLSRFGLILGTGLLLSAPVSAVTIDWVTVGNPGNPADTQVMNDGTTGYGSVPYVYQIGKYDVTNAQYTAFLNAVAQTDPNHVWSPNMDPASGFLGGITRSVGSSGFTYTAVSGRESMPVNNVSFYNALRFANWLQNGQPNTGAETAGTTEDGAYTITAQGISNNSITRNAGATIVLPSENEWYKAAYYNALTTTPSYFLYPAGSTLPTTCSTPPGAANSANCGRVVADLTNVGSYTGSASPYGTFDQGGNVWQWNEGIPSNGFRSRRGGSWDSTVGLNSSLELASSERAADGPSVTLPINGFRLALVPEPTTGLLVIAGLLSLAGWRRARD